MSPGNMKTAGMGPNSLLFMYGIQNKIFREGSLNPNTHSSSAPKKLLPLALQDFQTNNRFLWVFLCVGVVIYISVICRCISMHLQ